MGRNTTQVYTCVLKSHLQIACPPRERGGKKRWSLVTAEQWPPHTPVVEDSGLSASLPDSSMWLREPGSVVTSAETPGQCRNYPECSPRKSLRRRERRRLRALGASLREGFRLLWQCGVKARCSPESRVTITFFSSLPWKCQSTEGTLGNHRCLSW